MERLRMGRSTNWLLLLLVVCGLGTGNRIGQDGHLQFGTNNAGHNHVLLIGHKTRELLTVTITEENSRDFDNTSAAIEQLSSYFTNLTTSENDVWRRQEVGDVGTFIQTNLGQIYELLQALEQLVPTPSESNATLSSSIASKCSDLISTLEQLCGLALRFMTPGGAGVIAAWHGHGDIELRILKKTKSAFQGFDFESTKGNNRVYISVPEAAGRDAMAGMIAFSVQSAPKLLSGGSAGKVVTPVVVCSMLDATGKTLEVTTLDPVTFSLGHDGVMPNEDLNEVALCSYMDTNTDGSFSWSSTQCGLVSQTSAEVVCRCTHLTTFAVLYQQETLEDKVQMFAWLSCGFTFLCALVTVMTIIGYRLLDSDRSYVRINFLVALGMAEAIFLTGTRYTDVPTVCYMVVGFLHCCCLACFTWLFSYILLLGTEMRMTNPYRRVMNRGMYTVMGWGVPACVVMVSMIWRYEDYRDKYYCWLSTKHWLQLSFLLPIASVFIVSWVLLIYVIALYRKLRDDPCKRTLVAVTWSGIRSCTILNPLISATWVLAAFSITLRTIWLQALFAIFNVALGLTVFFSMCFLNEEVRLARRQRKIAPAEQESRFTPKSIEVESIIDGCESGNCIHKSKCFYGQAGFEYHSHPQKPCKEKRETPVAEGEAPKVAHQKWPTQSSGRPRLVDVTSDVRRARADDIEERPPSAYRADSMAHLLPALEEERGIEPLC